MVQTRLLENSIQSTFFIFQKKMRLNKEIVNIRKNNDVHVI